MDNTRSSVSNALMIACSILLCVVVTLFVMKEAEKDRRINTQKKLDETVAIEKELERTLHGLEIANADLKGTIRLQEEKINVIAERLNVSEAGIKEKDAELGTLRARMEDAIREKEELSKRLDKSFEDYLSIKFQLENLVKTREELEKRAKDIAEKEGISLGTIVITR